MINSKISCSKCGSESPRLHFKCNECGNFLRDKVANIDLFSTLSGLVDMPGETFDKILFSENKNFTSFLLVFALLKIYFFAIFFSFHFFENEIQKLLIMYGSFLLLLAFFLIIPFFVIRIPKIKQSGVKWSDLTAGLSYALTPIALSAAMLLFFEFIIYGEFLFSRSPSIVQFKQFFGILFLILEVATILWSLFLSSVLFYRLGLNKFISFIYSFILFFILSIFSFFIVNYFTAERFG
jgi:hypothetical protein